MHKTVWFDITNTSQVHFLLAIQSLINKNLYSSLFTGRDFSETVNLLNQRIGTNYLLFGGYHGKNNLRKALGIFSRFNEIRKKNLIFDISISCGSESAIWYSFYRHKKSIAFGDNDLAKQWTYSRFIDYSFFPRVIPTDKLVRQGLKKTKLYQYNGYKENIYIADYKPDSDFLSKIPFNDFIVVRPENLNANYINGNGVKSIVPELADLLIRNGFNVVFLPRYKSDRKLCYESPKIFIPEEPLNGLDLIYYSFAVLTGAGTLAREAACLNTPAVSFFAGKRLLAVDNDLVKKNKIFFSRKPYEILDYLNNARKKEPDLSVSKGVRDEVGYRLNEVLSNLL